MLLSPIDDLLFFEIEIGFRIFDIGVIIEIIEKSGGVLTSLFCRKMMEVERRPATLEV